jgi:2-keto-3-deoxy-L-rhamnonate aldolase RhmA
MHCFDAASARQALAAGFTMVSVGSDIGYLRDGAAAALLAAVPGR